MKYRSLTCIYFMRSILVSHWSISPYMIFIQQISFKILSKINDTKSLTYIYILWGQPLCHTDPLYQVWPSSINYSSSYNATSLDHEIYVSDPHLFSEANLCVTLIHYPKYNIPPSNSLQDIKQNHWTTKYMSLTYIYSMRSIFVSHWSIIQSMTFTHQIVFKK